jgi:tetrapyrrole methylase family protein / MazG family protein
MPDKSSFTELIEVMARLRAPDGCPWDRQQTHDSLKPYLLEEAYEALEAIDESDDEELCKELGDVLLQIVFHAQIASEEQRFDIDDVARAIVDKLVRRHPHIFADTEVADAEEVAANWDEIKKQERREKGDETPSHIDGIPKNLPALMRAQRMQTRASRQGFDWNDIKGPLDKVEEEFAELRQAWQEGEHRDIEDELGDLLFALVNTARFLEVNPEEALRRSVDKFERRFRAVEKKIEQRGEKMEDIPLASLDDVWDEVKRQER